MWQLRGAIDWLRRLGILPIELFFPLDGDGAIQWPFIFAMEIAEPDFLSSAPIVSSALAVPLFAVVSVIVIGLVIVTVLHFTPCDDAESLVAPLRRCCTLPSDASLGLCAMASSAIRCYFFPSSAHSFPLFFAFSLGQTCSILALFRRAC